MAEVLGVDGDDLYFLLEEDEPTVLAYVALKAPRVIEGAHAYHDLDALSRHDWVSPLATLSTTNRGLLAYTLAAGIPPEEPVVSKTFYV